MTLTCWTRECEVGFCENRNIRVLTLASTHPQNVLPVYRERPPLCNTRYPCFKRDWFPKTAFLLLLEGCTALDCVRFSRSDSSMAE